MGTRQRQLHRRRQRHRQGRRQRQRYRLRQRPHKRRRLSPIWGGGRGASHGARTRRTEHGARGASAAPAQMLDTLGCLWHYQTVRAPWTHEWLYWRSRDPRREQKESVAMLLKPALRSRSASGGDGFGSSVHWARCRSWRPGFWRPSNVGADARAVVHTRPPQPVQGYASLAAYFAAGGGEAAGGLALKRRRPNKSRMQRRRRRRQ